MAFMELEVTGRVDWYEIDGSDGSTFVPVEDIGWHDTTDLSWFLRYYEFHTVESVRVVRNQYGARYSAPGYLDCTPWIVGNNKRELIREVKSCYGDQD